jgi:dienelactone hydrolase
LFWARSQDPFSRRWFTLKTEDHASFDCVTVLPKPLRRCPVVVYAHASGGNLMEDGTDLRQMAELGLATVSLDYNQTNEVAFAAQWTDLLHYLARQKWADTNAIAWVGSSLGANWIFDLARRDAVAAMPVPKPQLLVLLSGAGLAPDATAQATAHGLPCPVLLIHGDQDEVFPVADTERLAAWLQTNGQPVTLKILPGLPHVLDPEREVVFRGVGEYCLSHLAGGNAWQHYHSLMQWQLEAPALWWFLLPALAAVIWRFWWRRKPVIRAAPGSGSVTISAEASAVVPMGNQGTAAPGPVTEPAARPGRVALSPGDIGLRWLAFLLATWALAETALHLVTPHFLVNPTTLSVARRILVQPKDKEDFEYLAAQPIWTDAKLQTLLDHAQLAGYNRQLVNWQLDEKLFRDAVLSPVIMGAPGERLDWRRPLWEEFYPRIRHEVALTDAARIIVRHLRERVTIAALPGLPRQVPEIWRRQITDQTGFAIIYVAALRSAGVPARLNARAETEYWSGDRWQTAPPPAIISW